MIRIRHAASRVAGVVTSPPAAALRWWRALEAEERILYRGLGLLGAGLAVVWPPAALIVPGVVFTALALGFNLRRGA